MRALLVAAAVMLGAGPAMAQQLYRLDAESHLQTVTVAPGDTIVVALDVPETSMAEWFVVSAPEFLTANGRLVSYASVAGSGNLLAKTYLYRFNVTRAGIGDIELEQRAPDAAEGETPVAIHRVTVNAGN